MHEFWWVSAGFGFRNFIKIEPKNNKIAATPGGPGVAKNYIDMGYNLLNIGADVIALSDYAENLVSQFEEINS